MDVKKRPYIIACIPALNEEKTIASVIIRTMKFVDAIVVCDDGSKDLTGEIAKALGAVVVQHEKNLGKGAALRSALKHAIVLNPDIVVLLDADGQHDSKELPKLIKPILSGEADIVIGSRYVGDSFLNAPPYRRFGLRIINALSGRGSALNIKDTQSGFRAFSTKALDAIFQGEVNGYGVETEQLVLATKMGLRVSEVPVDIRYSGLENTSKKHPLFHGFELIETILSLILEERPLMFLGVPGGVLTLFGLVLGGYALLDFNSTRYFSIPMILISMGGIITGLLLLISSLMLYSITRLKRRLNVSNNHGAL